MFWSGKKVLITGAYGFIGSHLTIKLLNKQADVAVLVRPASNPWRLQPYLSHLTVLHASIQNEQEVMQAVQQFQPDYIFHLAAYGTDAAKQNQQEAIAVNVIGTMNIVNAAKTVNCQKIIQLGSSSEYGDKTERIYEDMVLEPVDLYGSTKAAATMLAHQLANEYDLAFVTLRPFGVFGEKEDTHKLFSYVIQMILSHQEVKLTACLQYRDYCYVENIVDGMLLAAANPEVKRDIFNIGTGQGHPLTYFVDLIYEKIGTDQRPYYGAIPNRINERNAPIPDTTKIQRLLGWKPNVSVEEGLQKTIAYYKRQ